ncbi:MAG: hypothetical protein GF355_05255 [Candidatus Eisenbacteria bacterium]|nr:hypothetical protein [Candidatus Eisenbacteria bacterium]
MHTWKIAVPVLAGACLLAVWGAGGSPAAEGDWADRVESGQDCLMCHEDYAATLAGSVHEVTEVTEDAGPRQVTCLGCHDGWEAHLDDPSQETITTPPELAAGEQYEVCGRCHVTPHQRAMATTDPHSLENLACTTCHKIHDNPSEHLTLDDRDDYCRECHAAATAEFKRRSSHPLEAGILRCTDCHDLASIESALGGQEFDWSCQECHPEFSGPFPHEHPVVNEHLVEGGGCIECHEPHGSPNDRLLKQPGDGLCNQCHGIPPLHRTRHGGLAMGLNCVDCHSEIHGSYEDSRFLDPLLGTKLPADCYQSGCHVFGR